MVANYIIKRACNRFGGTQDSAFFRCDIWDLSSKLGWEAGIKITSGSRNFVFSWSWNSGSAKETECHTGFQSLFSRASETLEFAPPFFLTLCFHITQEKLSERGLPPKLTTTNRKEPILLMTVRAGMLSLEKENFRAQISRNVRR